MFFVCETESETPTCQRATTWHRFLATQPDRLGWQISPTLCIMSWLTSMTDGQHRIYRTSTTNGTDFANPTCVNLLVCELFCWNLNNHLHFIWLTHTKSLCPWVIRISLEGRQAPAFLTYPDGKVHGTNMGPTWVLLAPDGPHVGPMNLDIRVVYTSTMIVDVLWT